MKKYLDLASEEKDLERGISAKELLVGVEADIRAAYRKKYGNKR